MLLFIIIAATSMPIMIIPMSLSLGGSSDDFALHEGKQKKLINFSYFYNKSSILTYRFL